MGNRSLVIIFVATLAFAANEFIASFATSTSKPSPMASKPLTRSFGHKQKLVTVSKPQVQKNKKMKPSKKIFERELTVIPRSSTVNGPQPEAKSVDTKGREPWEMSRKEEAKAYGVFDTKKNEIEFSQLQS
ncbi:MAG: hypothetical protein AAF202_07030, partial [Pseudomonadota bacterium]